MEFTDTVLPDHKKLSVTCKVYAVVMQLPKNLSRFIMQTVEAFHSNSKHTQKPCAVQENLADNGSKVMRKSITVA